MLRKYLPTGVNKQALAFLCVLIGSGLNSVNAHGADITYNGLAPDGFFGSNYIDWNKSDNWDGTSANPTASDNAFLGNLPPSLEHDKFLIRTLNELALANSVTFQSSGADPAQVYHIGDVSQSNQVLRLGAPATASTSHVTNKSNATHVFDAQVIFEGTGKSSIVVESTGGLTFNDMVRSSILDVNGPGEGVVSFNGGLSVSDLNINDANVFFGASNPTIGTSITVGNGGTLSGTDVTFSGSTTIATGGTLHAEAGTVPMTFSNTLNFEAGSTLSWTLGNGNEITVGDISFAGNLHSIIDVPSSMTLADIDIGNSFVVFTGLTGAVEPTAATFAFTGNDSIFNGLALEWVASGSTLSLRVAAVPEPSTMVLLGVAGAIGGVVARRRAKQALTKQDAEVAVIA